VVATDGTLTGRTTTRTVTVGATTANGRVVITKGLKAGEKVVVTTGAPPGAGGAGGPSAG
jgi:hypothetical protein